MNKLSTRLCILHTRRSSVFFKMNMVYMYDISLIGLYTLVNNIVLQPKDRTSINSINEWNEI